MPITKLRDLLKPGITEVREGLPLFREGLRSLVKPITQKLSEVIQPGRKTATTIERGFTDFMQQPTERLVEIMTSRSTKRITEGKQEPDVSEFFMQELSGRLLALPFEIANRVAKTPFQIIKTFAEFDKPKEKDWYVPFVGDVDGYGKRAREYQQELFDQGIDTTTATLATIFRVGGESILDVVILQSWLKSGLKAVQAGYTPAIQEKISAWKILGQPKTKEIARQNMYQMSHQFHPDKMGGSGAGQKLLNDAWMVLKKGDTIPTTAELARAKAGIVAEKALSPISRIMELPNPIAVLPMKALPPGMQTVRLHAGIDPREITKAVGQSIVYKARTAETVADFTKSLTKSEITAIEGVGHTVVTILEAVKAITPTTPKELEPQEFFNQKFREPTLMKWITPGNRYARVLGVHDLLEPSIKAKTAMEIERANVFKQIDKLDITWRKLTGVSVVEKIKEGIKVIPPKAVQGLYNLLDTYSTSAKAGLTGKKAEIFDEMRSLTDGMLERANAVREMVGLEPIKKVSAYVTHIRDVVGKKELIEKYPFPEEIKYWLTRVHPKHIFNPTAFSRMIQDPINLLRDPFKALKTMASMDLKQVYLEQPNLLFREQLNELSEQIPASTRQWAEAYINEVIKGYPTEMDKITNASLEALGVKKALDTILKPFGRTTGFNMAKTFAGQLSRLVHDSVIWGRIKLVVRNHTQKFLSLGLYDTKAFIKGSFPANKELKEIIANSDFWKISNKEFMETSVGLTKGIIGKLEKIGFKPYSHSHISNVTHTMKTAYHAGMELVKNPKYAKLGWTKEDVIKEMEYGAQTAQYWYNSMGMPELYRSGLGKTLGNLQSWSQNYTTNYWREMLHRGFTGKTGWGKDIPLKWRVGALRHIITSLIFIEGARNAFGLDYSQVALLGVLPSYLSPQGQMAIGLANYVFGKSEYQRKTGFNQMKYSFTAFIPGGMAWKEFSRVWGGESSIKSLFFHTEKEPKKGLESAKEDILKKYNIGTDAPTQATDILKKYNIK